MLIILSVMFVISLIITIALFSHNRYNSLNSFLFLISSGLLLVIIMSIIFTYNLVYLYPLVAIIGLIFFIPVTFGIYFLIAFFFLNAYKVFKKESRSLANNLTLILGILGIIYLITTVIIIKTSNQFLIYGWQSITFIIVVYLIHFFLFILNVFLVNIIKPRQTPDYVIVLGSGLVNGKVMPLLASRINKGVEIANKYHVPIIFSGGQGADEPLPEGIAMKEYALENTNLNERILVEDKSINTYQNFKYSQEIIAEQDQNRNIKIDFVTSNYHVFRAGWYAHQSKIKAIGIGSKTAFYFIPNAIIREFVAMILLQKKYYIIMSIILILISILTFIFNMMNN